MVRPETLAGGRDLLDHPGVVGGRGAGAAEDVRVAVRVDGDGDAPAILRRPRRRSPEKVFPQLLAVRGPELGRVDHLAGAHAAHGRTGDVGVAGGVEHDVGRRLRSDELKVLLPDHVAVGARELDHREAAIGSEARAHDDDIAAVVDGEGAGRATAAGVAPGLHAGDERCRPPQLPVGTEPGHGHAPVQSLTEVLRAAYVHAVTGAHGHVVPVVLVDGRAVDVGPLEMGDGGGRGGRRRRGPGRGEDGEGHYDGDDQMRISAVRVHDAPLDLVA